ncbi:MULTISPECIES: hypothetical protein [Ramlibacter]|uniref:Uncharacterized protein n=1 Tax=Ramlibacter aquaticus TaxID=2780094 RepID=A0ABR9S9S2_9BURK|nr:MULTISPECIES: hypothetical protein [Ramlibacter]MBE7939103.1 hypothetical protein [Ramlibacter aquaticus]
MHIVIATLETSNFRFEAAGATEAEAMELLAGARSRHFDEMGQPANMVSSDAVLEATERPDTRYFVNSRAPPISTLSPTRTRVAVPPQLRPNRRGSVL